LSLAQRKGTLAFSAETEDELKRVLSRKKIRPLSDHGRAHRLRVYLDAPCGDVGAVPPVVACRDPDDDQFLAVALASGVSALVSGDDDLLVLHPFQGVPILRAGKFLERFA
jgi:putative PIN family toxin of toxin-antitoxin system